MEWSVVTVVILIPLLMSILAVVFFRGFFRVGAVLTLPLTAFASLADAYSATQKGNLTGLFTILISGPCLLVLLLLGLGEVLTRWKNRSRSRQLEFASEKEIHRAKNRQEALAWLYHSNFCSLGSAARHEWSDTCGGRFLDCRVRRGAQAPDLAAHDLGDLSDLADWRGYWGRRRRGSRHRARTTTREESTNTV